MFHHIKELQFDARVSGPDPRFASLLLEQFGGANGELKAAMQYFVQSFSVRQAYPDKYDMLIDIATEELSHLEIVGATITMLLNGVNGELKNAAEGNFLTRLMKGTQAREEMIHMAMANPQFLVLAGGGPRLTDCQGVPWSGAYPNANGDLTVDLRSDIAAESRAKIVYEYLCPHPARLKLYKSLGASVQDNLGRSVRGACRHPNGATANARSARSDRPIVHLLPRKHRRISLSRDAVL